MKALMTILAGLLMSWAAFANDGRVQLKIAVSSGATALSQEILNGKDSLSFQVFENGLQFNFGNFGHASAMFFSKEAGLDCATRISSYSSNLSYEVFYALDDRSEQGLLAECKAAGVKSLQPSRLVVTVIEKKTGATSSTVMVQK